mgnify:CR=1 FL=1
MTIDIAKCRWAGPLLPEPGPEVVRDLCDEVDRLRAELAAVTAERDEANANYVFMVERAADQTLDGYRELGQRAAEAENAADDVRAELAAAKADKAQAVEAAYFSGWGDGFANGCGQRDNGSRHTPFVSATDAWLASHACKALEATDGK